MHAVHMHAIDSLAGRVFTSCKMDSCTIVFLAVTSLLAGWQCCNATPALQLSFTVSTVSLLCTAGDRACIVTDGQICLFSGAQ